MIKNLLNTSIEELEKHIHTAGYPKFRAKQIFDWIYKKNILDFNLMSNLPQNLKCFLSDNFSTIKPQIIDVKLSNSDNSYKFLLKTNDANLIESIAIIKEDRVTLCVSCMIGCPLGCKFCATGTELKFKRNLEVSEILGQFIDVQAFLNQNKISPKINNIVFMGMGEPFLNIENIEKSINRFTSKDGFGISKNKITISTAGITKGLSEFINKYNIKLAVSIHFPTDEQRSEFMPINKKTPLNELITELKNIKLKKRDYITIEYLMINKINDTILHAQKLKNLIKSLKVKVNLIPYNPTKMFKAESSKEYQINEFAKYLNSKSIFTTVRRSKGKEFLGGCGQFVLNK
ncbi:MAG: 23S rRNA (adenine(2503)-C(2))-methyltransferase RlmN [bacterium]